MTMMRRLGSFLSFRDNSSDSTLPEKADVPEAMAAWEAMLKINGQISDLDRHQPSTQRGNRAIRKEDIRVEAKIKECAHRGLRDLVSDLGNAVDWGRLSPQTGEALDRMDAAKKAYRFAVKPMEQLYSALLIRQEYTSIDDLCAKIKVTLKLRQQDDAYFESLRAAILQKEEEANIPLQMLVRQLRREPSFSLVGSGEDLPNQLEGDELDGTSWNRTPLEMLYYCKSGAVALMDTTRIPACYSKQLTGALDSAGGTMKRVNNVISAAPQLRRPPMFKVIEASFANMQAAVSRTGTYQEINATGLETAWIVDYLGLADEGVYNRARARARTQAIPTRAPFAARCPVTGLKEPS